MSDLFDQKDATTQLAGQETKAADSSQTAVLVGEGRKYKSTDDLASAYIQADGHIAKIEAENKDLREAATKAATIETVLERIENARKPAESDQTKEAPQGLSENDVARIVESTVTGRESAQVAEANRAKANQTMATLFGDKAGEVFDSMANTDSKRKALTQLAEVDPEAFVALFKTSVPEGQRTTANSGTQQTAQSAVAAGGSDDPGTKAYFNEMRRKDPKKYYGRENQLAMLKVADSDQDKYFGRR